MNTRSATAIVVALLCAAAVGQQNSRSGAVRAQEADSASARKVVTLSGRVSDDGKVLLSEDQDQWAVNNPATLAGQSGRVVTVKCQLSADQNSIHVLAVRAVEARYLATHNDAAFRR